MMAHPLRVRAPLGSLLAGLSLAVGLHAAESPPVVIETNGFRWEIAPDGRHRRFVDRRTGHDHLRGGSGSPVARLRVSGEDRVADGIVRRGDELHVSFGGVEGDLVLRERSRARWVELSVVRVPGGSEEVTYLDLPLDLQGRPDEPFGVCALALDLRTWVPELPALQSHPRAVVRRRIGLDSDGVALVGSPPDEMLGILGEVILSAPGLPDTTVSGPWAGDVPSNRASYLFNFGSLTLGNVDEWIEMAGSLGFGQIDNHGGSRFFRFGDFRLDPSRWPGGWEEFREINRRLRAAGIGAIFHTYAFFIDKRARYVTPVPHPGLGAFRAFTLAAPISPTATEIPVEEPTSEVSTITGFFVRNSVTLHIGDELVTFRGVSSEPPWRFTGCQRGALGTRAAEHPRGAAARHLKECFGLFCPDPHSPLFEEIATSHASLVDRCGFEGIYLDAIDGADLLAGPDDAWHHASRFLHAIWRGLDRPVGMEMSAMWHPFWQFRTRWQAWDYPTRGHRRYIDIHAAAVRGGLMLPLHLGWWNFQHFDPPQVDPTYPEVIEYLGCKMVGHDAGVSLTGAVDPGRLRSVPLFRRLVSTLREYEVLRRSGRVSSEVRARLREPGREFTLESGEDGAARFLPVRRATRTVTLPGGWTEGWDVDNPWGAQAPSLRVECLMSVGSTRASPPVRLLDVGSARTAARVDGAPGVSASLRAAAARAPDGSPALQWRARREAGGPNGATWARVRRELDPELDLSGHQALGLWVRGDGGGELVGVRLESPRHVAHGAIADRYVRLDFEGWRRVELVEIESSRYSDHHWPDGWALYHVYREHVDMRRIETVTLWYNGLRPGRETRCLLGPVTALPMVEGRVEGLEIRIGDDLLPLPVALGSGDWLELSADGSLTVFGPRGEERRALTLPRDVPVLGPGTSRIAVRGRSAAVPRPRLRLVLTVRGAPLE